MSERSEAPGGDAPANGRARPGVNGAAAGPPALADFFASLAHALRSPIGVVAGALAELRSELPSQSTEERRLLVALADRGILRLRHIADKMSLVAALDSGTFELRRRSVDLAELLCDAAAMAAALEPRREVEIARELPADSCAAQADADRLARAVAELVINAIRHAVRRVRLRLESGAGEARMVIEDDGAGVAEERRATMFRRFAPRPSASGLGIGLSIAHDVIATHGGRITLEASTLPPGRAGTVGARFVISLPIDGAA